MLDRVPAIARPRAVSARMQTTAMRARSRPYSASACPSSRSWRDANHTRASLILESIRLLLSKLIDRLVRTFSAKLDGGGGAPVTPYVPGSRRFHRQQLPPGERPSTRAAAKEKRPAAIAQRAA